MASVRKQLRSLAHSTGGKAGRDAASDYLASVPDIAATGYVKMKYFDHTNPSLPSFETDNLGGIRLIARLSELERKLQPWTKRGIKGDKAHENLLFSTDEDAVLARLLIDG